MVELKTYAYLKLELFHVFRKSPKISLRHMFAKTRVETKHRIARNLARIARKFTRSTKIEIENARKKFARFLLGSKEDRKFYARDRPDRTSMLEMLARRSKSKLN